MKRPGCWCFILLRISPRLPYSLVNNVGARKQARSLITIVFFSIERARNPSLIPRPQPIANPFFYSPVPCVYHLFLFRLFIICLLSFGDRVFHLLAVWLYIFLSRWVRFSFFWVFAVFFFHTFPANRAKLRRTLLLFVALFVLFVQLFILNFFSPNSWAHTAAHLHTDLRRIEIIQSTSSFAHSVAAKEVCLLTILLLILRTKTKVLSVAIMMLCDYFERCVLVQKAF